MIPKMKGEAITTINQFKNNDRVRSGVQDESAFGERQTN
jgi:hypothetical protein